MKYNSILLKIYLIILSSSLYAIDSDFYFINKEYFIKAKAFESNSDIVDTVYAGDKVKLLFLQENLQSTNLSNLVNVFEIICMHAS